MAVLILQLTLAVNLDELIEKNERFLFSFRYVVASILNSSQQTSRVFVTSFRPREFYTVGSRLVEVNFEWNVK